jgi:hypothetical protein
MTTMKITKVEWTYRDKTYGVECKPADVDDLLRKVSGEVVAAVGETRDGMMGRLIDEIDGDPDNRNSWMPLGLSMLWFACNQELENPKGFGHHALRRAKEGGVSVCFHFEKVNYEQWEVHVYCRPRRRKGVREPGVHIMVHVHHKPENAIHH